jgi:peptidoglycan/LPS O-acetylase OafA/YrhL
MKNSETQFQCLPTTWYVSIEWQLTVFIAPVLIFILKKNEKLGLAVIGSLIAASVIGAGVLSYVRGDIIVDNLK